MQTMRIYIPTRSRQDRQPTYEFFKDVADIVFVCKREDIPHGWSGSWLATGDHQRIKATRQLILDSAPEDKFAVMDDDLRFFRRLPTGKLSHDVSPAELIRELNRVSNDYALTGIHPRFMINTAPPGLSEFSKMYHVMVFNRKKLPSPLPMFRIETGEDHDFHLQVIERGGRTAVLTEFAHDDKENAPGGCSDWRPDIFQDVTALKELWPQFVRINDAGRPVIYFKKAAKAVGG